MSGSSPVKPGNVEMPPPAPGFGEKTDELVKTKMSDTEADRVSLVVKIPLFTIVDKCPLPMLTCR